MVMLAALEKNNSLGNIYSPGVVKQKGESSGTAGRCYIDDGDLHTWRTGFEGCGGVRASIPE